jgi:hypothetical protein
MSRRNPIQHRRQWAMAEPTTEASRIRNEAVALMADREIVKFRRAALKRVRTMRGIGVGDCVGAAV